MRKIKKLRVLAAVCVFSAICAANASAAQFTNTVAGSLEVKSNQTQVFTFNNGAVTVSCIGVKMTAKTALSGTSQHATMNYSGCTLTSHPSGFTVSAHLSPATYEITAGDTSSVKNLHIKNSITVVGTGGILGNCHITIGLQTVGTVDYSSSGGLLTLAPNVSGIVYTSTGGICGASSNNGTYKGNVTIGVQGGSMSYDH